MRITCDTSVFPGWTAGKWRYPHLEAALFVKGVYRLVSEQPAIPWAEEAESVIGDLYLDDDPQKGLRYSSDFVPFKPRTDLSLVGTAYAPYGKPAGSFDVRFRVGEFSKTLRIHGPRNWKSSLMSGVTISPPGEILSLPLTYASAFGGPEYKLNPLGRGHQSEDGPQIEDARRRATGPRDNAEPAGFGPLPAAWPQRQEFVGTYDARWQKERWPWFPEDFDWGYFNAAPRDQQLDSRLVGDEPIELENLVPQKPFFRGQLPGVRPRCFLVQREPAGKSVFCEVPLALDTLWMDADQQKLVLVWRGMTAVSSIKLRDVERLFVFVESLADRPRTFQESYRLLQDHLAEQDAEFAALDAPDDDVAQAVATMEADMAAGDAQMAEYDAEIAAAEAEANRQFAEEAAAELPQGMTGVPVTLAPAAWPMSSADEQAIFSAAYAQLREQDPEGAASIEQPDLSQFDEMDKESAQMDAELAEIDPPPVSADQAAAQAAQGGSLAELDLAERDFSGMDLAGADFRETDLSGAKFVSAKLAGANFLGAQLGQADLSGADLTAAILDEADLTGAKLDGARLQNVSLSYTSLTGLNLAGADFSGAQGEWADFSTSDLTQAKFVGVRFKNPDFSNCKLAQADFTQAAMYRADLDAAVAPGIKMAGADITKLNATENADFTAGDFTGASAEGTVWGESVLDGAEFSRARLAGAIFADSSLKGARFDRADLSGASFDDAVLCQAVLSNANLLRCSFDRADLTEADLSGSNLYGAGFAETRLADVNLDRANLKGTALA